MIQKKSGSANNKAGSAKKFPRTDNFLESLRDIGGATGQTVKKDVLQGIPEDFMRQLFGTEKAPVRAHGDILPGQSVQLEKALNEERAENKALRSKLIQQRRLQESENTLIAESGQKLKVELYALTQEVASLAKTTQGLSKKVEIAAMQAPSNPGVYHLVFFERLRNFIASFRKKIENASLWLQSYNQRAAKRRTFWGQVSQSGSKRLLSPEDYLQRSAG